MNNHHGLNSGLIQDYASFKQEYLYLFLQGSFS